jgi:hypothetical protein
MLASFLGVLPILTPPLCALAFIIRVHILMKKVTKNLWSSLIFHTKANWLVGLILAVHGQILTFLIPVTMNTGASLSNAHT